ncbi:MAG: hypothetical protein HYZ28_06445 [Myxococcales bacterium]|nr:hypothetical protein [Myxococcales bacterium]
MDVGALSGAFCAGHPGTKATQCCPRCGAFMCPACERRVRPDSAAMCPSCWELRTRTVAPQKHSGTRLQTAGLVLGIISLIPLPAVQIASLIVNIIAIARAKEPPASEVRSRPIIGLVLTLLGFLGFVVLVAAAAS